ncbi:ABC transporter permease [Arthrobacter sp. ISL-30]|uniref:ABC transporter permease n=1 Tax=Arthrobacter sp. ISL-30 TaxID=2819109 RepID=UPI001BE511D5|nr:ABC transporter permease [Arthrobacter sp. ISL-30]MBT2514741.1 ABC transporter permease [Arthrobacter sp. ISL-30]
MTIVAAEPIAAPVVAPRKSMTRVWALVRQLLMSVLTLLLISFIAFAAMNRSPEQIARNALGISVTDEQLQSFITLQGLDRPLPVRYLDWLGHYLQGDWGTTLTSKLPIKPLVLPAFAHTAELALASLVWSLPVAIALGVFMARKGGVFDRVAFVVMTVLAALPEFVVGLGLMILLAVQLRWLPVSSSAVSGEVSFAWLQAFVLPALTLGLIVVPYVSRIARASVSEALNAPFTRNAVLRGLPRRRVVWRHATRSAAVPLVHAVALVMIYLLGGAIIVENVFAFPGLGRLLVQAIAQGDTNSALSITVLLGAVFIALSFVADIFVAYLNPRLKAAR